MERRDLPSILLIDRHENRRGYEVALRGAGLNVIAAEDSATALDEVHAARPQVIVVNGNHEAREESLSVCRAIRSDRRAQNTPILVVATDTNSDDFGLTTDLGCLLVTVKDGDTAKLVAAINGVLAARGTEPLSGSLRRRDNDLPHSA